MAIHSQSTMRFFTSTVGLIRLHTGGRKFKTKLPRSLAELFSPDIIGVGRLRRWVLLALL